MDPSASQRSLGSSLSRRVVRTSLRTPQSLKQATPGSPTEATFGPFRSSPGHAIRNQNARKVSSSSTPRGPASVRSIGPHQFTNNSSSALENLHESAKYIHSHRQELDSVAESEQEGVGGDMDHDGRTFDNILKDARSFFTDEEPDFLIKDPCEHGGEHTRAVELVRDGAMATLQFEYWSSPKRSAKGFWTLDLGRGEKYVVKYFPRGRGFFVWLNPEDGFDQVAIARPKTLSKNVSTTSPKNVSITSSKRDSTNPRSQIGNSEAKDEDDNGLGVTRSLRRKSKSQLVPYTAERFRHKRALQGKPKREDFFERRLQPVGTENRPADDVVISKKRRTSTESEPERRSGTPTQIRGTLGISHDHFNDRTWLYTRLRGSNIPGADVICLRDVQTIEALFDEIERAYGSNEAQPGSWQLLVSFEWLKENRSIAVRRHRPRSFEAVLEEINQAPHWKNGAVGTLRVDVEVLRL